MNECTHPVTRGPSPAMMEDADYRRVCVTCLRRIVVPEPVHNPDPDTMEMDIEDDGSMHEMEW